MCYRPCHRAWRRFCLGSSRTPHGIGVGARIAFSAARVGGLEGEASKVGAARAFRAAEAFGFGEEEIRINVAIELRREGRAGGGGAFVGIVPGLAH